MVIIQEARTRDHEAWPGFRRPEPGLRKSKPGTRNFGQRIGRSKRRSLNKSMTMERQNMVRSVYKSGGSGMIYDILTIMSSVFAFV
jgi:hypothetical protein